MWKSSDIKLLLSLLLIPVFLASNPLEAANFLSSKELTENLSNPDSQNLEESLKDIQETYKQFQELVKIFLGEIYEVRNDLKARESLNTYEINQKLKEIEAKVNQYKNNLPTTNAQVSELFDEINLIVKEIKPITEQLKEGLGKETIGKLQINLGYLVSGPSDPFYGALGPNTRARIKESLRGKGQQLEDKLTQLSKATEQVRKLPSTKTIEALNTKALVNKNEIEIEKLNNELKNISNGLNQLKTSLLMLWILVIIIVLVLAGIMLNLVVEASQSRRRKKLTQERNNIANSTDNFDIQELIFAVDDKVEDIYEKLEKMSNLWETQWRNLQNQTNDIQQSQQVKIPNDNADNKELTDSPTLQLISEYNKNPRSLLENPIEVSETDQSIDQRHRYGSQGATFQKFRKGNYWILNEGGIDYIVPKHNIKINEYNRSTVADLFECQGYIPEYSGFKLIKPARVSAISGGMWQLVEPGVLQFY